MKSLRRTTNRPRESSSPYRCIRGRAQAARRNRRGVAVILVLGFMAISFGMAYALLRAQASSMQLAGNYRRMEQAREAAFSGALAGIREIHADDWAGVATSFSANVTANSSYTVSFVTGDDSLQLGDADYDMWPYRVTIKSVGYAQDPADPLAVATANVHVVMQLIPENVATEPSIWQTARQYTAFQSKTVEANLNMHIRFEGPVRFQDKVLLGKDLPPKDEIRERYMRDLDLMRSNGFDDYRQFDTNVRLPYSKQSGTANALITLPFQGLGAIDEPKGETSMPAVGNYSTYQLYPGGAHYTAGTLNFYTRNETLEPDPKTNPLGLYYSSSNIRIEDNVTLRGTIIDGGDIVIDGTSIDLQAVDLPSIDGGATTVQLPVMIVGDAVDVEDDTKMNVTGSIASKGRFRFRQCGNGTEYTQQGRLLVGELTVGPWVDWPQYAVNWDFHYGAFLVQYDPDDGIPFDYFPDYLENVALLQIEPAFKISPPASAVTLHWMAAGEPLYAPVTAGEGLNWQVMDWIDNP